MQLASLDAELERDSFPIVRKFTQANSLPQIGSLADQILLASASIAARRRAEATPRERLLARAREIEPDSCADLLLRRVRSAGVAGMDAAGLWRWLSTTHAEKAFARSNVHTALVRLTGLGLLRQVYGGPTGRQRRYVAVSGSRA